MSIHHQEGIMYFDKKKEAGSIQSLQHEVNYWKDLSEEQSINASTKSGAVEIYSFLKPAISAFQFLESYNDDHRINRHQSLDFLEQSFSDGNSVDSSLYHIFQVADNDSKNYVYSAVRMRQLIQMMSMCLCKRLREIFPHPSQIFDLDIPMMKMIVVRSKNVLNCYQTMISRLTKIDFSLRDTDPWKQSWGYQSDIVTKLIHRIDTIYKVWATNDEIHSILSGRPKKDLQRMNIFKPFMYFDPLNIFDDTDSLLQEALREFDEQLRHFDSHIAQCIQKKVKNLDAPPFVILSTLEKLPFILERPGVVKHLEAVTSRLTKILKALLNSIDKAIDSSFGDNNIVEGIFKCRQYRKKCERIRAGFKVVARNDDIKVLCTDLENKCCYDERNLFNRWLQRADDFLKSSINSLSRTKALVEFDDNNLIHVTLSDGFAKVINDERKLSLLGFNTDSIRLPIVTAKKYCRIGNFLNKALMLRNQIEQCASVEEKELIHHSLTHFDDFVKKHCKKTDPYSSTMSDNSLSLCWTDHDESEKFASKLNEIAKELCKESKRTDFYRKINSKQIRALLKCDLISKKSTWLQLYSDVEKYLLEQTSDKYSKWTTYWIHQVFKAFDVTYIRGLMYLNTVSRDIACELVVHENVIQIRPTLSEIRSDLYSQLRSFVEFPIIHSSVFSENTYFNLIPIINHEKVSEVYKFCESCIFELKELVTQYSKKAIPYFDVATYTKKHCRGAMEFANCMQWLKSQIKLVDRWPEMEVLNGNIRVSLRVVKDHIKDRIQFLQNSFNIELQQSAIYDYNVVQDFILSTKALFSYIPSKVDDLKLVESAWNAAKLEISSIEETAAMAYEKFGLICSLSKNSPDLSISSSFYEKRKEMQLEQNKSWQDLIEYQHSFVVELTEKKNSAKHVLLKDSEQLVKEFVVLESSWTLSKAAALKDENWEQIDIHLSQCLVLVDRRNKMQNDCIYLGIDSLTNCSLDTLYMDLLRHEEEKNMIDEFGNEQSLLFQSKWKRFDINELKAFLSRWKPRIDEGCFKSALGGYLESQLSLYERCFPLLIEYFDDAYNDEHWAELFYVILKIPRQISLVEVTVQDLMEAKEKLLSPSTITLLKELHIRALEEIALRETLDGVIAWYKSFSLESINHQHGGRCTLIMSYLSESNCLICEQLGIISCLKESIYFKFISDVSSLYEAKLVKGSRMIEKLNEIQRKWLYLEPIYSNETIMIDKGLFISLDNVYRAMMMRNNCPKLSQLLDEDFNPDLENILDKLIHDLKKCQHALFEFLEEKRCQFPRLYFLGDESLLDILGHTNEPDLMHPHIKYIFQAIYSLVLDEKKTEIIAFESSYSERVLLKSTIKVRNVPIEKWLNSLCDEQRRSLQHDLFSSFSSSSDLDLIRCTSTSQMISLHNSISFTRRIESIFHCQRESFFDVKEDLLHKISNVATNASSTVNQLQQRKEHTLILQMIHHRDIIETLIKNNCNHSSDWVWVSQLRYSLENDCCNIKIGDALFKYSFEYQGNEERLVQTMLTDKCYLNLTQAMRFGFGGNPFGPAGTGKTETVKALGVSLGRQVLVFNCDDELNYKSIGRIFSGLVMSGAWGCFDEFNRLREDQLSAIADQIQSIQNALKGEQDNLVILDKSIRINHNVAIFITMNPVCSDYKGRSNLPSNLKMLFRPVAMGYPDNSKIAEVALLSYGFHNASVLGSKLNHTFTCAKTLLTTKKHYDWGLRSIKAIIRCAGDNRRLIITDNMTKDQIFKAENDLIVASMSGSIIRKLDKIDLDAFKGLVLQIFEPCDIKRDCNSNVVDALRAKDCDETTIEKVIQLNEALQERTGCIIVGDVNSGKSFLWKQLRAAKNSTGDPVECSVINPKSIPRNHLFGKLNTETGEWRDGIITSQLRSAIMNKRDTWIICDGDIDPEWIESLNSVLDDNRLLTLPTGERLHLTSGIKFIFETRDLTFTSPATISRNAILRVNSERDPVHESIANIDLHTLKSWINNNEHFVLLGKTGSGRDSLVQEAFSSQPGTIIQSIYCNESTETNDIIKLIKENYHLASTHLGTVYQPIKSKKIALILKDIECIGFDKYGSSALLAFFNHLFDYGGFYDDDAKFHYLKGIQVIFIGESIEIFQNHSKHLLQRLQKNMRVGVRSLPLIDDIAIHTSSLLGTLWPQNVMVSFEKNESKRLADLILRVFIKLGERHHISTSLSTIPFYILNNWMTNLTKYSGYLDMKSVCLAFEIRRSMENVIFDTAESKDIPKIVSDICNEMGIDYSLSHHFFSPLSHKNFSLISHDEAKEILHNKHVNLTDKYSIELCYDAMCALSDLQHALYTGSKNVVLLGECRSGKQTLLKLACQMNSIEYIPLIATPTWNRSNFRSTLQQLLIKAGNEEKICIHVDEFILTENSMLSILCQILSGGISCLNVVFDSKQLKQCLSILYKENFQIDGDMYHNLKHKFLSNIVTNLNICISFHSPMNNGKELFRRHPSLKRYAQVVFVRDWSDNDLKNFVKKKYEEKLSQINKSPEILMDTAMKIHHSTVRSLGSSQRDFLELISIWLKRFEVQNEKNIVYMRDLDLGLKKLKDVSDKVIQLQVEANVVEQNVIHAQAAADKAMTEITSEMTKSHVKMQEIECIKSDLEKKSNECNDRKDFIESEIEKIRPVLEASKEAVKGIKREHLNEIKSFKTPPQQICDVLSGVLMLQGIKDLSWNSMKAFLTKRGMIQDILNFDVKDVSSATIDNVKKMFSKKAKSFEKSNISRVSIAAAPLAAWVSANIEYANILTTIKPLETELNCMKKGLDEYRAILLSCEYTMKEINDKVHDLKLKFSSKLKEAEGLKLQLESAKTRSESAVSLINQLHDEKERWNIQKANIEKRNSSLWCNLLFHSAFTTYLGNQNERTREEFKDTWLALLHEYDNGVPFDVLQPYAKDLRRWQIWGLNHDNTSLHNAAIIASSSWKVPYIIDPNGIAIQWLKHFVSNDGSKSMEIAQATDLNLNTKLEVCIKSGRSLIIKDYYDFQPFMLPLLRGDISYENSRCHVTIGTKRIEYNSNFKLFLISKQTCCHVPKGIIRVVNFTTTPGGLTNRLLSILLSCVQPSLTDDLQQLTEDEEKGATQLSQMETKLLELLCVSDGDLLDDDTLVKALINTKHTSNTMLRTLDEISKAKEKIRQSQNEWISIASISSSLYFLLLQLETINHFYRFSTQGFEMIYENTIKDIKFENICDSDLCNKIVNTILLTYLPSISDEDHLVYFIHFAHGLHPYLWKDRTWDAFISTSFADTDDDLPECPQWLNRHNQKFLLYLKTTIPEIKIPSLASEEWKEWSLCDEDLISKFPSNFSDELRLLLIKGFHPDKLNESASQYCCNLLGLESLQTNSRTLFDQWSTFLEKLQVPVMFVTGPEVDPGPEIESLANTMQHSLISISLGGCSIDEVIQLLQRCAIQGHWLLLKNLHLAVSLLSALEKQLDMISVNCHNHFRLWLTTEKKDSLPPSLIERSHKIICDGTSGLKESVKQTYAYWEELFSSNYELNQDLISSTRGSKLLFILAWTHAILRERKTFKTFGWKENYDFTSGDLFSATKIIEIYHNDDKAMEKIPFLLKNFIYGGKMTNICDQRILNSYIDKNFSENILNGNNELFPGFSFNDHWDKHCQYRSVRDIPTVDSPSTFGLPLNSMNLVQHELTHSMMRKLQTMESSISIKKNDDRPPCYDNVQLVTQHWKKIASNLDVTSSIDDPTTKWLDDPFQHFIFKEVLLSHTIVKQVFISIDFLEKGLTGVIEKDSLRLHRLLESLNNRLPPNIWKEYWSGGPTDVIHWMSELIRKRKSLLSFHQNEVDILKSATTINLSDFFNVEGFLCAMKQKVAKAYGFTMEEVTILGQFHSLHPNQKDSKGPECAISIGNLYLRGATLFEKLDDYFIQPAKEHTPDFDLSPSVKLLFLNKYKRISNQSDCTFLIPVYLNTFSEEELFHVSVHDERGDHRTWILAGVAMYLER